ncbi:DNA gyrase inhibitor YacG [Croceicoccus sp. F390]|uniref:DNA gyrase inhibitor YacG n=1 Tax=Croceicoccus esteveae TaxID=3075597 RepID=A0ABU2ZFE2_9SPHN|nr:DNA gyrase inhibitor YacG [Croceicoccus sp. F390]MDT0575315.1 DNA gyrase inhibitor YacG [Croceicoccus sp. F390]
MTKPRRCPMCGKPAADDHRPFCSSRCRDRDLANWLGDGYAIPAEPAMPHQLQDDDPDGAAN